MRFANLHDWLAWQEQLHPTEIELGLDRVAEVLRRMDLGVPGFGVITVAGTNGKGSCAVMLDAIYRSAGYSTGLYTSPHLKIYNERIAIDGVCVSDFQLCEIFGEIDQCRQDISLTYFEFGTLAAIALMVKANVDIAILEVGLGGRLDAVNVLDADVTIISSIGTDHKDWLGDDREKIAIEKAGIARRGKPVVCGELQPPDSLLRYLQDINAPLYLLNRDFFVDREFVDENLMAELGSRPGYSWSWKDQHRHRKNLPIPALRGDMQLYNAACVLKVIDLMNMRWPVTQANIREGLTTAYLPGRFQVVPGDVTLVIDVAHNVEAAAALAQHLKSLPCNGSTFAVFGCFRDKDLSGILAQMSHLIDRWFVATLPGSRARKAGEIADCISQLSDQIPIEICESVGLAKESAVAAANRGDRVVLFGSFLVASEVL